MRAMACGGFGAGPLATCELFEPALNGGKGGWGPPDSIPDLPAGASSDFAITALQPSGIVVVSGGTSFGPEPEPMLRI